LTILPFRSPFSNYLKNEAKNRENLTKMQANRWVGGITLEWQHNPWAGSMILGLVASLPRSESKSQKNPNNLRCSVDKTTGKPIQSGVRTKRYCFCVP